MKVSRVYEVWAGVIHSLRLCYKRRAGYRCYGKDNYKECK